MQLSSTATSASTVVTANGELDIATTGELRSFLADVAATGIPAVPVDLSEVDFLDSATLGVLVGIRKLLTDLVHDSTWYVPRNSWSASSA